MSLNQIPLQQPAELFADQLGGHNNGVRATKTSAPHRFVSFPFSRLLAGHRHRTRRRQCKHLFERAPANCFIWRFGQDLRNDRRRAPLLRALSACWPFRAGPGDSSLRERAFVCLAIRLGVKSLSRRPELANSSSEHCSFVWRLAIAKSVCFTGHTHTHTRPGSAPSNHLAASRDRCDKYLQLSLTSSNGPASLKGRRGMLVGVPLVGGHFFAPQKRGID